MSMSLAALRETIRKLEGGPRVVKQRTPCGVPSIDNIIGGLPSPGMVEVHGPLGSGRSRLATAVCAAMTHAHHQVAWVDPLKQVYPPGLAQQGVSLHRLLLIQPAEDGSSPWVWCAEQVLRSGNFPVVIIDMPYTKRGMGRRTTGQQWARAAEFGRATALILSRFPSQNIPADIRLATDGHRLRVVRDRGGQAAATTVHMPSPRAVASRRDSSTTLTVPSVQRPFHALAD